MTQFLNILLQSILILNKPQCYVLLKYQRYMSHNHCGKHIAALLLNHLLAT